MRPALGILGGTFDPVHCAHLRMAIEMREQLGLDRVDLMPAPYPRLRGTPSASPVQRLEMLRAAVADLDGLEVDGRELKRTGPTRTVETLEQLRSELPRTGPDDTPSLVFVMGMDAFSRFDLWSGYERILELAHLAVICRPGAPLPTSGVPAELLASLGDQSVDNVRARPAGSIFVQAIPELDISATAIRARVAAGRSIRYLVPDQVRELIEKYGIYRDAN